MTTQDSTVSYMRYPGAIVTNSCINTRGDLLSRLINEHTCTKNVAEHTGTSAENFIIDVGTGGLWDTRNVTGLYLKFNLALENVSLPTGTAYTKDDDVQVPLNLNTILEKLGNSAFCIDSVEVENSKYKIRDQYVNTTSRIYQKLLPTEFLQMYPNTFPSSYNKPRTYAGIVTTAAAADKDIGRAKITDPVEVELFIPAWMLHSCWRNMQLFPAFLLGIRTVRLIINTRAFGGTGFAQALTGAAGFSCTSMVLKSMQFKTLNRNIDKVFDDYRTLLAQDNKYLSSVDQIEMQLYPDIPTGRIVNQELPFARESVKYLCIEVVDKAGIPLDLSPIKSLSIRQGSASDKKVNSDPLNLEELKMYTLNCLQELACDGPIDGYKHNPSIDTSKMIVLNLGVLDTKPGMSFVGYNNYDKYTAIQLEVEVSEQCNLKVYACYDYFWMINKDGTMSYTDKNPKVLGRD